MADACLIDFAWPDWLTRTDLAGLTVWRMLDGARGRVNTRRTMHVRADLWHTSTPKETR